MAWVAARRGSLQLAVSAVLLCGLLVSHHAFCADAFVVVPAAVFLWDAATHSAHKILALLLLCPLVYLPLLTTPHPLVHPAIILLAALATIAVWGGGEPLAKPAQTIAK